MKAFMPLLELIGALYSLAIGLIVVLPTIAIFMLAVLSQLLIYRQYDQEFTQKWGVKFGGVLRSCRSLHGLIQVS